MKYQIELTKKQFEAITKNLDARKQEDMMADTVVAWEEPLNVLIKALGNAKQIKRPRIAVVRFWDETDDGDASAEGILKSNHIDHDAGGGPEFFGDVRERGEHHNGTRYTGRKTYVTIN